MPWHVTPIENLQSILREGLIPGRGPRSLAVGEEADRVHLFSSFADLQNADWLWDEFEEEQSLGLLHVTCPAQEGAWTELDAPVPPDQIRLLSLDAGNIASEAAIQALTALDGVTDPLADIESFRQTRVDMKASDFGLLVGDMQWENDADTVFLVYAAGFWIEQLENGMQMLLTGNRSMITAEGTTLADLEEALFDYAVEESRPLPDEVDATPAP